MAFLMTSFNLLSEFFEDGIKLGNIKISDADVMFVVYKLLFTGVTLIIMFLTVKIGSAIISKFVEKQKRLKYSLDIKKAKTLGAVLKSLLRYSVYFLGVMSILTEFFGTISLTFASIGGVAIGFGSQSLVKDIINGFFILFEDHFAVGDYIEIEGKSGIVESVELRVTKLRDLNGDLHTLPNGLINKVTNHSRGDMRMQVAIDLPYNEDMDRVIEIINEVCLSFKDKHKNVVEGPTVAGITDLKENFYTIKIAGKAKPMTQWDNENNLRMEIKRAFDKAEIKLAYSKIQIVKEG